MQNITRPVLWEKPIDHARGKDKSALSFYQKTDNSVCLKNYNNPETGFKIQKSLLQDESEKTQKLRITSLETTARIPSASSVPAALPVKEREVRKGLKYAIDYQIEISSTHYSCCNSEHKSLLQLGSKLMYCNE